MISLPRCLPWLACVFALSAFAGDAGVHPGAEALRNWPQWRWPLANGVAPLANPPIHWSETNNVRWKIPIPGKAHSSPIVFCDSVYVLAAMPLGGGQKLVFDGAAGVRDS